MSLNLTNSQKQQTPRKEAKRAIKSCEYTLRSHIKKQNPPCKSQETQRNEAKRASKSCELLYTKITHIKEAKPSMQKTRNEKK